MHSENLGGLAKLAKHYPIMMPRGSQGQKRLADVIGAAVMVAIGRAPQHSDTGVVLDCSDAAPVATPQRFRPPR